VSEPFVCVHLLATDTCRVCSPPVKPEPRTSEASEAAMLIAGTWVTDGTAIDVAAKEIDAFARAAKEEALLGVAKAGCESCGGRLPEVDREVSRHADRWAHWAKERRYGLFSCQRPEVWDALQALREGGR